VSSIPTTPAITNAIFNAVGVRVDRLPVDQEKIARELWEKRNHDYTLSQNYLTPPISLK
jgi:hypothetical protein